MPSPPYRASWVDGLTARIDRLPIPAVVLYVLVYIVAVAALHVSAWLDGVAPWGEPVGEMFSNGFWAVVGLGIIHALEGVAAASVSRFRVLLADEDGDDLAYRLTHLPARTVLWIMGTAAVVLITVFAATPDFVYEEMSHPVSWVLTGLVVVWSYSFAPLLIFFLIRQLVLVSRAFALVPQVKVLQQQPLYGLSRLPFMAGLAFLVVVNASIADALLRDQASADFLLTAVASGAMIVLAFAAFIVPVTGIHARIKREKERLLEQNGGHLQQAHDQLYRAVAEQDSDGVDAADKAISSLNRVRDDLGKVRTWPWSPGTVRSFLSAVLLPMVVWGLQAVADRIL